MEHSSVAWRRNLQASVERLQQLVLTYMTTKDDGTADAVLQATKGLKAYFGPSMVPRVLEELEGYLRYFRDNKNDPQRFGNLMNTYLGLQSVASFADDQASTISFDDIFEAYKADAELQKLVNELTETLRKIIAEGDENLSAQIIRDLEAILAELSKAEKKSLYELQAWVDLGVRALLVVVETHEGWHGLVLVREAAKLLWKIKGNLYGYYGEALKSLIAKRGMKFIGKSYEKHPELPSEEELLRRFPALKDSDLTKQP